MAQSSTVEVSTPSDLEISARRKFLAPPAKLFEVATTPELIQRYMKLSAFEWAKCEVNARLGGGFTFVWRNPEGTEITMAAEYVEFDPAGPRIVHRPCDSISGHKQITLNFGSDDNGAATLHETILLYNTKDERDAALQSPMLDRMEQNFRSLDGLLAELRG
eukprot:TRINITY_DN7794_c0_g1_i1.p1 TRINITY_DN7794_c0_g1~~TRINITY_DN7794_c0_g1_i1.p1  ORF type:complete len:179 (+),score=60.29 TRINITY_DN7794_c0_g1_i1:54-539(+)